MMQPVVEHTNRTQYPGTQNDEVCPHLNEGIVALKLSRGRNADSVDTYLSPLQEMEEKTCSSWGVINEPFDGSNRAIMPEQDDGDREMKYYIEHEIDENMSDTSTWIDENE